MAGQTFTTYVLGHSDVGTTLRVAVTATNSTGSGQAVSAPTGFVTEPSAACTRTLGPGEGVAAAVDAAAAGNVICLSSGSYGPLTFTTNHSSDVTLKSEPRVPRIGKLDIMPTI